MLRLSPHNSYTDCEEYLQALSLTRLSACSALVFFVVVVVGGYYFGELFKQLLIGFALAQATPYVLCCGQSWNITDMTMQNDCEFYILKDTLTGAVRFRADCGSNLTMEIVSWDSKKKRAWTPVSVYGRKTVSEYTNFYSRDWTFISEP